MLLIDDKEKKKENDGDNPFVTVPLTDSLHPKKDDNSESLLEKYRS